MIDRSIPFPSFGNSMALGIHRMQPGKLGMVWLARLGGQTDGIFQVGHKTIQILTMPTCLPMYLHFIPAQRLYRFSSNMHNTHTPHTLITYTDTGTGTGTPSPSPTHTHTLRAQGSTTHHSIETSRADRQTTGEIFMVGCPCRELA